MELVLKSGLFGYPIINSNKVHSIIDSESRDSIGNIWTRAIDTILDFVSRTERVQTQKDMFDVFSKNSKCNDKDKVFDQLKNRMSPDFDGEFKKVTRDNGSTVYSIYIKNQLLISSDMDINVVKDDISDSESENLSDLENDQSSSQCQDTKVKYQDIPKHTLNEVRFLNQPANRTIINFNASFEQLKFNDGGTEYSIVIGNKKLTISPDIVNTLIKDYAPTSKVQSKPKNLLGPENDQSGPQHQDTKVKGQGTSKNYTFNRENAEYKDNYGVCHNRFDVLRNSAD